jgi:two-component system copper resistance phosphate regulon response regulator CusR
MRLLLVEDEARMAHFIARGLRERAYAVDISADGDDALYKLSINDYDAVILDIMIPGRNGFEVCREMRAGGLQIPVLMTSLAAILGMLPLALALGSGAELLQPLAIAVIGGLAVALLFSLVVTPTVYAMLHTETAGQQVAGKSV